MNPGVLLRAREPVILCEQATGPMKYKNWKLGNGPLGLQLFSQDTVSLTSVFMPTSERTRDPMHGWPWPQNRLWLDPQRPAVSVSRWPMLSRISRSSNQWGHSWRASKPAWVPPSNFRSVLTRENPAAEPCKQLFSVQTTVPAWWWACLTCILTWFVWTHKSIFKQQILYGYPNCWVSYNRQALAPSETMQMSPTTTLVNFKQLIPFQGLWIKACYTSSEPLLFLLSLHM